MVAGKREGLARLACCSCAGSQVAAAESRCGPAAQAATGVAAAIKRYSPCEWEKAFLPYLAGCRQVAAAYLCTASSLYIAGVLYTIVSWIRGNI